MGNMGFSLLYVWATELFPTDIRTRTLGFQSACARVGAIVSPFVVDLGARNPQLALCIFAVPVLVTGALNLCLPETRGTQPPNTIGDVVVRARRRSVSEEVH